MVFPKGSVIVWIFQTITEKRNHVTVQKGIGNHVIEWLLTPDYNVALINTEPQALFVLVQTKHRTISEFEKLQHAITFYDQIKQPSKWQTWVETQQQKHRQWYYYQLLNLYEFCSNKRPFHHRKIQIPRFPCHQRRRHRRHALQNQKSSDNFFGHR